MFYLLISFVLALIAPEFGLHLAESFREFAGVTWHGFWFWLMGAFIYGLITN